MKYLFKAKVKNNGNHLFSGDWVQGSLIIKTKGYFVYVIEEDDLGNIVREFEVEVIPETVCQFVGLLDKKSNRIFENDFDNNYDVISFCESRCGWSLKTYDHPTKEFMFCNCYNCEGNFELSEIESEHIDEIEIIGNIYD